MLNCFTSLMYSLVTDRGKVLALFKQKAFYWCNPYSLPRVATSLKGPSEKKKEQIKKQNSWIWVHLSLVLEKSHRKVVVLFFSMNLSPFISITHFFFPHNHKRRGSVLGICMLHLLAPGVPLSLSCFVSQQTYRVDYIAQKTQEIPWDCFFLEKHSSVVYCIMKCVSPLSFKHEINIWWLKYMEMLTFFA